MDLSLQKSFFVRLRKCLLVLDLYYFKKVNSVILFVLLKGNAIPSTLPSMRSVQKIFE